MEQVLQALQRRVSDGGRIPIVWSAGKREELRRVARGELTTAAPVDRLLAPLLLMCADGRSFEAEVAILDLVRQNLAECERGSESFISLLFATFVLQRFDVLAGLLRQRYGFARPLELAARRDGPGLGRVRWEILPDGIHRFTFDAKAFENDNTRIEILAFQWAFPVYANYAAQPQQETGGVIINQQDIGQTPGLAWCDNRPDYFLVPDCIFVPTKGYAYAREVLRANAMPWQERKPVAFWRGATTGIPAVPGDWRTLERIRLCELARRHAQTGLIDAGISSVIQFADPAVAREIQEAGLMLGPVPWQQWGQYKYLIDIDGNSSPWSNLFQRLLTGSVVLKVESSRALQQWFYDELVPWGNYVPIAPDLSDLMDKIGWLARNDGAAQRIGQGGLALAERLTYEREIARSARVVAAAFRYLNGKPEGVGPYGREVAANPTV
ncbi:MAG TPA: glycosyl transferase family 90 [Acetobacteraceae bacterium]|nr:glycosyl transferase family 90 [Acetobacteraceae bacterium]